MFYNTLIYANLLPCIAIIALMVLMLNNSLFDRKQNKLFFLSSLIILFMILVISIDYAASFTEFDKAWLVRRITSFLHFSFSCTVPFFLIRIFVNKKLSLYMYLPALINLVMCFISMFTNLIFFFPREGGYERGPFFIFPFLITVIYIIILLMVSLKERKNRYLESLFLFITIISLCFALYLEIMHYFKFLSWDFAAIFLILYYLLLNINRSKIDILTSAANRSAYMEKIQKINRSHNCIVAMIDINNFKFINDTKGHEVGDRVLIQFAKIVKSFLGSKSNLYRIGGDEFTIISEKESMEKFKNRLDACMLALGKENIFCAIGIVEYSSSMDIEEAISIADEKMYADKRKYYSSNT